MAKKDKLSHDEYVVALLNEARDMWGISIAELARRSGIAELRLGNILRGDRRLHGDELARLLTVMSIPLRTACPARYLPKRQPMPGKIVLDPMERGEGR